jgi:hypothetical protein
VQIAADVVGYNTHEAGEDVQRMSLLRTREIGHTDHIFLRLRMEFEICSKKVDFTGASPECAMEMLCEYAREKRVLREKCGKILSLLGRAEEPKGNPPAPYDDGAGNRALIGLAVFRVN